MMSTQSDAPYRRRLKRFRVLAYAAIFLSVPLSAWPQTVRTRDEIARTLSIERVNIADGAVSGEVFNRSSNTVRDVQLFIRYTWLWDNETKPGKPDPGTSTDYTLPGEIPAGGRVPFSFKPSAPLTKAPGGHFETSVGVAGFAEVIPQTR
jgi:hypothetical protein